MERLFLLLGAASGFLGVALGAFGAHALRARIPAEMLRIWEVGVHYQLVHAVALLFLALAFARFHPGLLKPAGFAFIAGTLLFSGSLYVLALTGIRAIGMITPLGGLCFLAGWALIAMAALKS